MITCDIYEKIHYYKLSQTYFKVYIKQLPSEEKSAVEKQCSSEATSLDKWKFKELVPDCHFQGMSFKVDHDLSSMLSYFIK